MTTQQRHLASGLAALALIVGAAGCARPELNPDVRITGDRENAVPVTEATTTTAATTTTTTLYFGDK